MSHMVIFGAGASYGSGDVTPYPPPLGNQLFEKLEALGKTASRIPPHIKESFKENFEKGMAEYFIHSDMNIMSFQRDLAGYLAKFTPGEVNHYSRLIRKLNNRRTIYSTLNYDLLFEIAANRLNYNTNYSNEYNNGFVRLLKIHGSCNFWPNLAENAFKNVHITGCVDADMNIGIKPVSQSQSLWKAMTEDSIAPSLAMYAEGKAVRVSPGYVLHQQEMWVQSLNAASKVFIVGVKIHQADIHIWKNLAECKADIHYFGLEQDKADFKEWQKRSRHKNATFYKLDFKNAVDTIANLAR